MERVREKMLQARLERELFREKNAAGNVAGAQAADSADTATAGPRLTRSLARPGMLVWLAAGLVTGGVVISVLMWANLDELRSSDDLVALQADTQLRQQQSSTIQELKSNLFRLDKSLQQITTAVAGLEDRMLDIQADLDARAGSEDAGAAPVQTAPVSVVKSDTMSMPEPTPAMAAASQPVAEQPDTGRQDQDSASAEAASTGGKPVGMASGGPWVINLASLPNQEAAESYVQKAGSRGVDTQWTQVTIKGRNYWRVQVTGFPSSAAAAASSVDIKERLGLKDVWIARQ